MITLKQTDLWYPKIIQIYRYPKYPSWMGSLKKKWIDASLLVYAFWSLLLNKCTQLNKCKVPQATRIFVFSALKATGPRGNFKMSCFILNWDPVKTLHKLLFWLVNKTLIMTLMIEATGWIVTRCSVPDQFLSSFIIIYEKKASIFPWAMPIFTAIKSNLYYTLGYM